LFKLLFLLIIAFLLYQILKSAQLRPKGKPPAGERSPKRRQVRFDRSQVIDAEFKEVEEDAEAEK
jgi:hypothetical protein